MPRRKDACSLCGRPKLAISRTCRTCSEPYERTADHRRHMAETTAGKPKPWLQGRSRPWHSEIMQEWWTEDRREEKRQEMLLRNPDARYHGLSANGAKRFVESAGRCQECDGDGSESRLEVHHKDRDKRNQAPENLIVLCHRCHMQEHAGASESGWDVYHQKRKTTPG